MRLRDGLQLTARALLGRPLRSVLTLLGVAIGIAAVVLLTAIGEGLRFYVLDTFSQFGTRIGYRIRLADYDDFLRRRTLTGVIAAHLLKAASTAPDA